MARPATLADLTALGLSVVADPSASGTILLTPITETGVSWIGIGGSVVVVDALTAENGTYLTAEDGTTLLY